MCGPFITAPELTAEFLGVSYFSVVKYEAGIVW